MTEDAFDFDAAMAALEVPLPVTKPAAQQADSDWNAGVDAPQRRQRPLRTWQQKREDRIKRQKRKLRKLAETSADFTKANPGIVEFLNDNAHWSSFVGSLLNQFHAKGSLSEKQVQVVRSMQAKCAERREQRAKEVEARKVQADLSPIKTMFDRARESGLKRTKYRAEGLELSPASERGRNPGAIYVKRGETYLGKVMNGQFHAVREATENDKAAVLRIAENPREAAVRWGQKTGKCSCCGRELTNKASIAAGIGPICATKWGL